MNTKTVATGSSWQFIKNWSCISCTAFLLNYLLWYLTTEDASMEQFQYQWFDYAFDFTYCALYVLVSLSVSNLIRKLLLDRSLHDKSFIARKRHTFSQFFLHSGAMLVVNVLIAVVFETIVCTVWQGSDEMFWERLHVFTTIATLLTIIYLSLYYSSIIIRQGSRNAEMQKELLKLQLDPHFVLNSLSTLTELIDEDPELAEVFTLKFSSIYRYIVGQLNKETVSVAEEIQFLREYCDLLDIRHPQHYTFLISEELYHDTHFILPMSIQILVENAVKHNAHSCRQPLQIEIFKEDGSVVVRNKRIPLVWNMPSTNKIGLKNLRERYALLGLKPVINDTEDAFEVRIPFIHTK